MSVAVYTSPLRPLDIDYTSRVTGIAIEWDHTDLGEWSPTMRYAFSEPLPPPLVEQYSLELSETRR